MSRKFQLDAHAPMYNVAIFLSSPALGDELLGRVSGMVRASKARVLNLALSGVGGAGKAYTNCWGMLGWDDIDAGPEMLQKWRTAFGEGSEGVASIEPLHFHSGSYPKSTWIKRFEAPVAEAPLPEPAIRGAAIVEALRELDADQVRTLSVYMRSYARARAEQDQESVEYFEEAIHQLFDPPSAGESEDLSALAADLAQTDVGRKAMKEIEAAERRFFENYQRLKAAKGLNTYRKVAAAAGISLTTVQAIEDQRIKPQFRTIEKLAAAFGVPVTELLDPDDA